MTPYLWAEGFLGGGSLIRWSTSKSTNVDRSTSRSAAARPAPLYNQWHLLRVQLPASQCLCQLSCFVPGVFHDGYESSFSDECSFSDEWMHGSCITASDQASLFSAS